MLSQLTSGQASKALVAGLTAIAAALPLYFGSARWEPVVVMAIGAVLTYLIPNAPKPAPAPEQAVAPQVRNL